jgi:hypothetical protein
MLSLKHSQHNIAQVWIPALPLPGYSGRSLNLFWPSDLGMEFSEWLNVQYI